MALKWADNVIEQSTATTTGAYQLAGVPSTGIAPGAQGYVTGIGDANTCYYYAYEVSGTAWERGIGTVADAATDTLTRTTIHGSSNGGSAVDWTGKTVRIRAVEPARRLYHDHAYLAENLTIATSRTGNAETIALKTLAGNDPSVADPIRIGFNDASGAFSVLEITAATSLTISSGSTLGATNATCFRVWLVGFNDAGTFRLGAIKCALTDGVYGLRDNVPESSTAEGGAGAADSSGVIYTATAVTSKVMRVLGYLEYTLATAGTWGTAPSLVVLHTPGNSLPGTTIAHRRSIVTDKTDCNGTFPYDDTIPQNTEGTQVTTVSITPRSLTSLLRIRAQVYGWGSTNSAVIAAIYRDSGADALAAALGTSVNSTVGAITMETYEQAPSASAITYKLRAGMTSGVLYVNASSASARVFGGVEPTILSVEEIQT